MATSESWFQLIVAIWVLLFKRDKMTDRLGWFPLSQNSSLKYLENVNPEIFRDLKSVGYLLSRKERADYHPNNFDIGIYPFATRLYLKVCCHLP